MNCPLDGTELRMTDRQGVEVDYCPKCRGVWLDRGELDKLIARGDERDDDDRTSYQRRITISGAALTTMVPRAIATAGTKASGASYSTSTESAT